MDTHGQEVGAGVSGGGSILPGESPLECSAEISGGKVGRGKGQKLEQIGMWFETSKRQLHGSADTLNSERRNIV